jgi:hypothetical protein
MGGAAGHLSHVVEDYSLTFAQVYQLCSGVGRGILEDVSEKIDGMNIVYTVSDSGQIRCARNGGDISRGGMTADELAAKFSGRGNLSIAFNQGFQTLTDVCADLPPEVISTVFLNGRRWYSAEIVYSDNPNVINYDGNHIVFHRSPIFEFNPETGKTSPAADSAWADKINQLARQFEQKGTSTGWQVHSALKTSLKAMADESSLLSLKSTLNEMAGSVGKSESITLGEYVQISLTGIVRERLGEAALEQIVKRMMEIPGCLTLTQIKKLIPPESYVGTKALVESSPKLIKSILRPLEIAIHKFSVDLLRGMGSVLVKDHRQEVERLRMAVSFAVDSIKDRMNDSIKTQLEKLGDISNISSSMEGIVVMFEGNAYKFTGAFAPVNQILGMGRYAK